MPFIAAGIGAAGAIGGGLLSSSGSKGAAKTQSAAAQQAALLQLMQFQAGEARLDPFTTTGQISNQQLGGLLGITGGGPVGGGLPSGGLTKPFGAWDPTMAGLAATPGYQFTLQQGLNAVKNQASAQGLGPGVAPGGGTAMSGPEATAGANYAENLASTTYLQQFGVYNQQFQNYWGQLNNIYNMLQGVSTEGANTAAGTGQLGTTAGANIGNALQTGAAGSAAGQIGSANALGGIGTSIGNIANNAAFLRLLQPQSTGDSLTFPGQFAQPLTPGSVSPGGFIAPSGSGPGAGSPTGGPVSF